MKTKPIPKPEPVRIPCTAAVAREIRTALAGGRHRHSIGWSEEAWEVLNQMQACDFNCVMVPPEDKPKQ